MLFIHTSLLFKSLLETFSKFKRKLLNTFHILLWMFLFYYVRNHTTYELCFQFNVLTKYVPSLVNFYEICFQLKKWYLSCIHMYNATFLAMFSKKFDLFMACVFNIKLIYFIAKLFTKCSSFLQDRFGSTCLSIYAMW